MVVRRFLAAFHPERSSRTRAWRRPSPITCSGPAEGPARAGLARRLRRDRRGRRAPREGDEDDAGASSGCPSSSRASGPRDTTTTAGSGGLCRRANATPRWPPSPPSAWPGRGSSGPETAGKYWSNTTTSWRAMLGDGRTGVTRADHRAPARSAPRARPARSAREGSQLSAARTPPASCPRCRATGRSPPLIEEGRDTRRRVLRVDEFAGTGDGRRRRQLKACVRAR